MYCMFLKAYSTNVRTQRIVEERSSKSSTFFFGQNRFLIIMYCAAIVETVMFLYLQQHFAEVSHFHRS